MTTKYTCYYEFDREPRSVQSLNGLAVFRDGFWIDSDCRLTTGLDARYWIPPHKIEFITADRVDD